MKIIETKEANCKSCYKCIRYCHLKAISFNDDQAHVIDDACVLCGKCTLVCPQKAKVVVSEVQLVKNYISRGEKVFVSLAPSYVSVFPKTEFAAVSKTLKKLGFAHVEETSIGAAKVTESYTKLIEENNMKNIITTCCYSTVMLIEKYYPELVPFLAPVMSPMSAHCEMMRETYGKDIKTVFIGPCISKKQEAKENNVDAVIMFDELKQWFKEENIDLYEDEPDENVAEMHSPEARVYPVPGGIIKTIPVEQRINYKYIAVDGMYRLIKTFDTLKDTELSGYFIETSTCAGSCVEGPAISSELNTPFLLLKEIVVKNAKKETLSTNKTSENATIDISKKYRYTKTADDMPDEQTIKEILLEIGKADKSSMLNCGTCGYQTCRDKAIAVYQGKADLKMCLPYMRERAESMSNTILENTPNAIFVVDKNFRIVEFNLKASKMFNLEDTVIAGDCVAKVIDLSVLEKVKQTGTSIYDEPTTEIDGTLFVEQTVITMGKEDYLIIIKDVTQEVETNLKRETFRTEAIQTAQKVIDKQMRVAQEIASLLGETTGETKVALTKLKKSIEQGDRL